MFNKHLYITGVVLLLFLSCKKDKVELSPVPSIELVSISPSIATEYTDQVVLSIQYHDGDGDLGENTAGVKNCFVRDNRIGTTTEYRIQQLSPDNSSIAIQGILNLELGGQGITDGSNEQSVTFSVYVRDRAGNSSNEITTPAIRIRKP